MSNWRIFIVIGCIAISLAALAFYFQVVRSAAAPTVIAATGATDTEIAYYLQTANYGFYISQDAKYLEIRDSAQQSIKLDLSGDMDFSGLEISAWTKANTDAGGNSLLLPPQDCKYVQLMTYPGLFHTELAKAAASIKCKSDLDRNQLQSLEE